jgi:nicotinamide riboside kinase
VPEVGRAVSEARGVPYVWTDADFEMIARRQQRDEDRAARRSGPVLVCDTDALATCIWQERYLGRSTGPVEAIAASRSYSLSVLTSDDIPFVQDGLRDGEHLRGWMTERFRERLREPWIEVRGTVDERVDQVLARMFSRT